MYSCGKESHNTTQPSEVMPSEGTDVYKSSGVDCSAFTARRGYCVQYVNDRLRGIHAPVVSVEAAKDFPIHGQTPREPSVIVFGPTSINPYGHVAWVERIEQQSMKVIVSQMNAGSFRNATPQEVACGVTDKFGVESPGEFYYDGPQKNQNSLGFYYPPPSPLTGSIAVQATLDGKSWQGTVACSLAGPQPKTVRQVPITFTAMPVGDYRISGCSG